MKYFWQRAASYFSPCPGVVCVALDKPLLCLYTQTRGYQLQKILLITSENILGYLK